MQNHGVKTAELLCPAPFVNFLILSSSQSHCLVSYVRLWIQFWNSCVCYLCHTAHSSWIDYLMKSGTRRLLRHLLRVFSFDKERNELFTSKTFGSVELTFFFCSTLSGNEYPAVHVIQKVERSWLWSWKHIISLLSRIKPRSFPFYPADSLTEFIRHHTC
jgi:hypothetical protein